MDGKNRQSCRCDRPCRKSRDPPIVIHHLKDRGETMPIYAIDGIAPVFDDRDSNWIAPDATLIGRIRIGRDVSVWFGVALRGDNERIEIGEGSNVQEHTIMH